MMLSIKTTVVSLVALLSLVAFFFFVFYNSNDASSSSNAASNVQQAKKLLLSEKIFFDSSLKSSQESSIEVDFTPQKCQSSTTKKKRTKNTKFFVPKFDSRHLLAQSCPVLFFIPSSPSAEKLSRYQDLLCAAVFSNRTSQYDEIYKTSSIMDGYHLDYAIIERARVHPCELSNYLTFKHRSSKKIKNNVSYTHTKRRTNFDKADEEEEEAEIRATAMKFIFSSSASFKQFEFDHDTKIVGLLPFLLQTNLVIPEVKYMNVHPDSGVIPRLCENRNHQQNNFAETLTKFNRWYLFTPQFQRPSSRYKFLKKYPYVNTITNEVALWAVNPFIRTVNPEKIDVQHHYLFSDISPQHPFYNLDARTKCSRHIVIPKIDWNFVGETSKNSNRSAVSVVAAVSSPFPKSAAAAVNSGRNILLYFQGRVQTTERLLLQRLALKTKPTSSFHPLVYFTRTHKRLLTKVSNDNVTYQTNNNNKFEGANVQIQNLFHFQSGGKSEEIYSQKSYVRMMKRSVFCIDTTGDDLTTRRITSAVLAGCIPVLLCDDCVFPFPKLFPYEISGSSSKDDVLDHTLGTSYRDANMNFHFPVFYIRLSVKNVLNVKPSRIIDILVKALHRKPFQKQSVLSMLQENLLKVQSMFLSMLDPSSTFMEAMMSEMALSLSDAWYQSDEKTRLGCWY